MGSLALQPRFVRAGQAHGYCGMDARTFGEFIRPKLTVIKIGKQGVGFDRFELDEVLDEYKEQYGRAPEVNKGQNKCKNEERQGSLSLTASGISTRQSMVSDFAKAAKQAKSKKLKSS